jgi:peptidoglycan/LPS O-acetylase OafA/YrhL
VTTHLHILGCIGRPDGDRSPSHAYLPALDGLRALAVAAVVLYHLGLPRVRGGYLGVDLFFVLSGYLITGLLVGEWDGRGRVSFRRFYARRARRLLPALFVLLAALLAWVAWRRSTLLDPDGLRRDIAATLAYVANWRFVAVGSSYFDQFTDPSALRHAWSLAIEEQYYLFWPLLLVALLRIARGNRRRVLLGTVLLATASAVAMAVLYTPGHDPSRVYYGTDTRAFELLGGSALALVLAGRRWRLPEWVGAVALVALVVQWLTVGDTAAWMYRGGFVLATVLGAIVVGAVARTADDGGPLTRALSIAPLRGLGRISYGVYLWHWPVIVLLRPPTIDVSGDTLRVVQVAVTLAISIASYLVIEQPVRTGALLRRGAWAASAAAPAAAVVLVGVIVATASPPVSRTAAPAVASPPISSTTTAAPRVSLNPGRTPTAADPLRVLLVGDSVMVDASPGIEAAIEATGVAAVEPGGFPGFGLTYTKSWRRDWTDMVAKVRPDVVVVLLGAWDADNALAHPPDWYAGVVDDATAILAERGARVVWLGWPPTRPPAVAGRAEPDYDHIELQRDTVDAAFRTVADRHAGDVAYVDTGSTLSLPDGSFSAFLPDPTTGAMVRARKHDNTHFCPSGAERMGRLVLGALTPVFALPAPPPTWTAGDWRADPRYDDPPGACR